eukprot:354229-Chlamydomonas_euryale.AAC.3
MTTRSRTYGTTCRRCDERGGGGVGWRCGADVWYNLSQVWRGRGGWAMEGKGGFAAGLRVALFSSHTVCYENGSMQVWGKGGELASSRPACRPFALLSAHPVWNNASWGAGWHPYQTPSNKYDRKATRRLACGTLRGSQQLWAANNHASGGPSDACPLAHTLRALTHLSVPDPLPVALSISDPALPYQRLKYLPPPSDACQSTHAPAGRGQHRRPRARVPVPQDRHLD